MLSPEQVQVLTACGRNRKTAQMSGSKKNNSLEFNNLQNDTAQMSGFGIFATDS
jgi:hypothetical protein